MITRSMMYWITRCDGLNSAATGLVIVLVLASFALFVISSVLAAMASEDTLPWKTVKRVSSYAVYCILATVLSFFVKASIPTTREMAAIVVVPAIASAENLEKVGKAADSLFTLANEWMQELRPRGKASPHADENDTAPAKAQN